MPARGAGEGRGAVSSHNGRNAANAPVLTRARATCAREEHGRTSRGGGAGAKNHRAPQQSQKGCCRTAISRAESHCTAVAAFGRPRALSRAKEPPMTEKKALFDQPSDVEAVEGRVEVDGPD